MEADSKVSSFYENGTFQDFYRLLEVDSKATVEEIKKNYRRLCKMYHPDAPTANEEKMKQLGIAYGILKNSDTRNLYDEYYNSEEKRNSAPYRYQSSEFGTSNNQKSENQSRSNNWTFTNSSSQSNDRNFKKNSFAEDPYFSEQTISDMLKQCGYIEYDIKRFLFWCREHHIYISTGKELHQQFDAFQSMRKGFKKSQSASSSSHCYQTRQGTSFKNSTDVSRSSYESHVFDFMAMRRVIMARMIERIWMEESYYQNRTPLFLRSPMFPNLHIYPSNLSSKKIILYPYLPTTRIIFYSKPKIYIYKSA